MNTSLMPPGLVVVSARIGRVGQSCAGAGPDRTKDKTAAIKIDNTVRIKACYWVS